MIPPTAPRRARANGVADVTVGLEDFLAVLFHDARGKVELRAVPRDRGDGPVPTCFSDPGAAAWRAGFLTTHPTKHIYFGVATRRDGSSGKLENCLDVGAVWVDLDFAKISEEEARTRLAAFPLPPSIALRSGGGAHLYWLLVQRLAVLDPRLRPLLVALARALHGDPAVVDPARCLRLPGSKNWKYNPPREAFISSWHPERRYTLDALLAAVPPIEPHAGNGHAPAPPVEETIPDGQRNATLASPAGSMRRRGMTPEEIAVALAEVNRNRCRPPLPDDEVEAIARNIGRYAPADEATPPTTETPTETTAPWAWAASFQGEAIMRAIITRPRFVIDELFSQGHQHAVVGAAGACKSWVLSALVVAVACPEVTTFLGQPVHVHGPAVLESWEQGPDEDLRRLQKLLRGHGLTAAPDTLILQSRPFLTLQDDGAYAARLRDFEAAGVILYACDSLSEAAGIELNDNTRYSAWWRARVQPLLDHNITVVFTHLRGHLKPGTSGDPDAAVRGATQIRALCTSVLECRHLSPTMTLLLHNKHRDTGALPLGILTLMGGHGEPTITLDLRAAPTAAASNAKRDRARRELLTLARQHPAGITRALIDGALSASGRPKAERISKRIYGPVIEDLVKEEVFQAFTLGRADAWRLIRDPDASGESEDDD